MGINDVYLSAIGCYLPETISAAEAVASGSYDADWAAEDGIEAVAVEDELSAPEMAVRAGRQALSRSGLEAADISLLLHATVFRQGPEGWPSPSYVERFVVGNAAPALEIRQGCNGALAGLDFARSHLQIPGRTAVMITCADRFVAPVDRWRSNKGMVFGDGASAVVVSRGPGFARIRGLATRSDSTLEEMHRGDEPLAHSVRQREAIDMGPRKAAFMRNGALARVRKRCDAQVTGAVGQALADAGVKMNDVARVIISNLGHKSLKQMYLAPLEIPLERTTWNWGRRIGHLGNSDQLLSLEYQLSTGNLHEGDIVLLVGMGVGFIWTAVVLEILCRPEWAR